MRRLLLLAALAASLSVPVAVTPSSPVSAATTATGTITDDLGNPIEAAQARFCQVSPPGPCNNHVTNVDGVYSTNLPAGGYTIQFFPGELFQIEKWDNKFGVQAFDIATVVFDQVNTFDAALERRPMVSGTITDDAGQPVEDVQVAICNDVTAGCALAQSAADGTYSTRTDPQVSTVSFREPGHTIEYWDDQPDETSATPVDFTDHVDRTLSPVLERRTRLVVGNITEDLGGTLSSVAVRACRVDINVCETTATNASGDYSLQLDAFTYWLRFGTAGSSTPHRLEFFDDKRLFTDATLITLAANETLTADAELATKVELSGTLTDDDDAALLEGVLVRACGLINTCATDTTDASGTYSIDLWAGDTYAVEFDGSSISYSSEYYDDTTEGSALRLDAVPGTPLSGVDVGLSTAPNLTGTVTRTTNGMPVGGVQVTACLSFETDCVGATTDTDGTYELRAEPGSYFVYFDAGFLNLGSKYYGDTYVYDDAQLVEIELGIVDTGIDSVLEPVGIVRGRVTDENFAVVEGIEVRVCRLPDTLFCTYPVTDVTGGWATIVNPGPTYVQFSDPNGFYGSVTWDPTTPGAFDAIEVASGQTVSDIDITMSAPGSISGTVTDGNGAPIPNVAVSANNPSFPFRSATTVANGTYLIEGLSTNGNYQVEFSAAAYVEALFPASVSVSPGMTTPDIDAQLIQAGQISGTVTDQQGNAVAGVRVIACTNPPFGCDASTETLVDGTYTLSQLAPGAWLLHFIDQTEGNGDTWYENAIDSNGATAVVVVGGQITQDIDVAFTLPGSLTGFADLPSGGPLVGESVEACRTDGTGCVVTLTSDDGTYEFGQISPGTYRVRAHPQGGHAPTFYGGSSTVAAALPVTITSGLEASGIDITVASAAFVSGRVTDASGTGLFVSQVHPRACSQAADFCGSGLLSNGEYTIAGLPAADDYVVQFPNQLVTNAFETEWYCDSESESSALRIDVRAGETNNGIDASMRRVADTDHDTCDRDADEVLDPIDNCPDTPNTDQRDSDNDGHGDACDEPEVPPALLTPLTSPSRLADSRPNPTVDDLFRDTGRRAASTSWEVQVAGRGGVDSDATAAVLNLTMVSSLERGFATVFECGTRPTASSLNYSPGSATANEVIAQLSPTGSVCVFTSSSAHVIIDVVGQLTNSPYAAIGPARYADSRDAPTFDEAERNTGLRTGGTTWEIPVAGRGDVSNDAAAVVANLTVTEASGRGFATAFPCGDRPTASSVNFAPGGAFANELIAKLSPAGTVCVFTSIDAHVILDVVGALSADVGYSSLNPARFADSRDAPTFDSAFRDTARRAANTIWEVDVAGRGEVDSDASIVVANVTITGSTERGFATVFACGEQPPTSSLNYGVGVTRPNEVITELSASGTICVYMSAAAHVIIDVVGAL